MERMSSGSEALDLILGGGYHLNSTNLIMGMPGTGKTVLAESIAFHNATADRPALFLSTVSEPLDRMLRYVQAFRFFDIDKVGEALIYEDLSETLRTQGLQPTIDHIVDLIKEHRPGILVVDSFKALHSFSSSQTEFRSALSLLAGVLSSLAITSFFVGEYAADEISVLPEFAVVDSIVELVLKKQGTSDVRYLRVTKLRGSAFAVGEHAFRIGAGRPRALPAPGHTGRAHQLRPRDLAVVHRRRSAGRDALRGPLEGQLDHRLRPARQRQDAARPPLHLQGHRARGEGSHRDACRRTPRNCSASSPGSAGTSRRPSTPACSRCCTCPRSAPTSTRSWGA